MQAQVIPQPLPPSAAELVRQFGLILAGLVALVARRFLREPKLVMLTVPLCRWLGRVVQRFARAMTRTGARATPARVGRIGRAGLGGGPRPAAERLPAGKAWLVRVLGWEAVAYGSQLEHLLAGPDMQATLAALPAVGRILRPLCRMLGVPAILVSAPEAEVEVVAAKERVEAGGVAWARLEDGVVAERVVRTKDG